MDQITDKQRKARVEETMRIAGVDEATAEFMLAQELGEVEGDVVAISPGDENE